MRASKINRSSKFSTTAYRFPSERTILWITVGTVILVIGFTAAATVCLSIVFILAMLGMAYISNRNFHQSLMANSRQVTVENTPELASLANACLSRLQVPNVAVYVAQSNRLNAYTFGLSNPRVIVLNSSLFQIMDADELSFIISHEMGHVKLGHTWLNTLLGGMAGIPSPYAAFALLHLVFRWWNRTCEYSADRGGLLGCGNPEKAITALIKLAEGKKIVSQSELSDALSRLSTEDDDIINNLGELLATHPLTINRIEKLQSFAKSRKYKKLQERVNRNLES